MYLPRLPHVQAFAQKSFCNDGMTSTTDVGDNKALKHTHFYAMLSLPTGDKFHTLYMSVSLPVISLARLNLLAN